MTTSFTPDELVEDGEQYFYRNGRWTNEQGMCVSLTRSQQMTMKFYELHGRSPKVEPKKPKTRKRATKKTQAKTDALRAAIAKAQGNKG